jgi:hypothetical protein
MSEYRQLFDDAIGAGEPSTVDVAGIISWQRRRSRLRGAVLVTLAAAAVVAIAVGVTALPGTIGGRDPSRHGVVPGAPGPSVQPPATASKAPATVPPGSAVRAATAAELTRVLKRRFAAIAPAVTVKSDGPEFPALQFKPYQDRSSPASPLTSWIYETPSVASTRFGSGTLIVQVSRGPIGDWCDPKRDPVNCKVTRGPGHETIVAYVEHGSWDGRTSAKTKARIMAYRLRVLKADGTLVDVVSDTTLTKGSFSATRPALTMAQMIQIALDPGLVLKAG